MSDSFYEGYSEDEVEVKEIEGITDTVTDYTFVGLTYPCIVFREGFTLEKHKVQVISNMVNSISKGVKDDISIYFNNNGDLYKLGEINGLQVSSLIDIVGRDNLMAFIDKGEELKGSLIYTLCSI